jgi:hypothetical protein
LVPNASADGKRRLTAATARSLWGVSESPRQLRKHITALEAFEKKFGEWVTGLHNERVEERPAWRRKERARRERELRELATPAEWAMRASGAGMHAVGWPPATGRQDVMIGNLGSLIFYDGPIGLSDGGDLKVQRDILNHIPGSTVWPTAQAAGGRRRARAGAVRCRPARAEAGLAGLAGGRGWGQGRRRGADRPRTGRTRGPGEGDGRLLTVLGAQRPGQGWYGRKGL